jgi:hypothetical protein
MKPTRSAGQSFRVNGQLVSMRVIDGHELDARVHQGRDERQIACHVWTNSQRDRPSDPRLRSIGMFGAYALGYGGTYASVGPSGDYGGGYAPSGSARGRYARGSAGGRNIEADLCSGQSAGLTDWPIERIAQTVEPNDAQRGLLNDLKDARRCRAHRRGGSTRCASGSRPC